MTPTPRDLLKLVQAEAARRGTYSGTVDGIVGPKTMLALTVLSVATDIAAKLPRGFSSWSEKRRIAGLAQAVLLLAGLEAGAVDGYVGPSTQHAFEGFTVLQATGKAPKAWRDAPVPVQERALQPLRANIWPRQSDVEKFFGKPGENLTKLVLPFDLKIAWNKVQKIRAFQIHERCHDSASRVFFRIADAYTEEQRERLGLNLFGGCFNIRKMRGGSKLSMHSWGIAIDFDPARNQLKWGRDKAALAHPDCETFWKFWEEEGWVSLGRARNYDFMHVQSARL